MTKVEQTADCFSELEMMAHLHGVSADVVDPNRLRHLMSHLAHCAHCQSAWQAERVFDQTLLQRFIAPMPLANLEAAVVAGLRESHRRWPVAAVAALVLVCLLGSAGVALSAVGLWQLGFAEAVLWLAKASTAFAVTIDVVLLIGKSLQPLVQLILLISSLLLIPLLPLMLKRGASL